VTTLGQSRRGDHLRDISALPLTSVVLMHRHERREARQKRTSGIKLVRPDYRLGFAGSIACESLIDSRPIRPSLRQFCRRVGVGRQGFTWERHCARCLAISSWITARFWVRILLPRPQNSFDFSHIGSGAGRRRRLRMGPLTAIFLQQLKWTRIPQAVQCLTDYL
jgi:hypothetical protein